MTGWVISLLKGKNRPPNLLLTAPRTRTRKPILPRAPAQCTRARTRALRRPPTPPRRRWKGYRDISAAFGSRASSSPSIWLHVASFARAKSLISSGGISSGEGAAVLVPHLMPNIERFESAAQCTLTNELVAHPIGRASRRRAHSSA